MSLFNNIVEKKESLSLVGLGYVGMPIAHAFAKKGINVIHSIPCSVAHDLGEGH